jgi:hypothetical protein
MELQRTDLLRPCRQQKKRAGFDLVIGMRILMRTRFLLCEFAA